MYHILTFSSEGFSSEGRGPPPVFFFISDYLWTIIQWSIFTISWSNVFKAFSFLNIKYIRNLYQLTKANFSNMIIHVYYINVLYFYFRILNTYWLPSFWGALYILPFFLHIFHCPKTGWTGIDSGRIQVEIYTTWLVSEL